MKKRYINKKLAIAILFSALLTGYYFINVNLPDAPGELTKKQLIQIARKAMKDQYNIDVGGCYYDRGNRIWNQHYAKDYPELFGCNFQAIMCSPPKRLSNIWSQEKQGVGYHWVCIDKKTGEVLQYDIGQ